MKIFLSTFVACFLFEVIFVTFGGYKLLESAWGVMALLAAVAAGLITALLHQQVMLEELSKRVKELESRENGDK